ncbi:apolipoprotein N-acyltransferase [Actinomyces sp. 186855]|nr:MULTISPECIES: apolipoprotein N-acyltransferase [unclassified Actinomyces]MCL3778190.1 apolipoprotein N-acyltransferase [Actinomyces sp. AC-20-1]MCL3788893.1 apolipoprotein N-acyltransferase [Actinomyces sp. 187325]MCL3792207.1 apolipoprotein N-acyltransferase [Actinomyces sp. 186855]MCL3794166.1 apolipoprotein N-acyltransferase [Actinomyces sp. 217892]
MASGLLLWTAFPPHDLWLAAPVALALLALATRGRGAREAAVTSLLFGAGLFAPLLHFTRVSMGHPIGWVALTVVESLYLAALGCAWALVSRSGPLVAGRWAPGARAVAFAVLWCGVEELRSSWPWGGFPFGRLAFAMADSPSLPLAAYGGSVGLSLLVALVGGCLAEAVLALRGRRLLGVLAAGACAGVLLLAPLALPLPSAAQDGTMRVAAVQGSVAHDEEAFARALEVTSNHAQATLDLAQEVGEGGVDLVVWPENAADLDPRGYSASAVLVEGAAQAVGAPVLVGAVPFADGARYNDVVVWTPGQGAGDYYRKHRPVPFGEFIPLRPLVRAVTDQADRIGTDMVAGTGPHTLTVRAAAQDRDVVVALGICFEVAYDDVLRAGVLEGGSLIVIPTNNASFVGSSESEQQLAQGRVQAVVHARSVVQVSTVGVTAVIGPRGAVVQRLDDGVQGALVADVGLRHHVTVADRLGAWPGRAVLVGAGLLAVAGIVSHARAQVRRRRRSGR